MVFIFFLPLIVKLFESMSGLLGLYMTIFSFYGRFMLFAGIDTITKIFHTIYTILFEILTGFQLKGIVGIFSSFVRYGCATLGAIFISVLFSFILKLKK